MSWGVSMFYLLVLGVTGYMAVLSYLYVNQRRLIYRPDTVIGPPSSYGLSGFEERFIRNDDSPLQLWYHAQEPRMPLVVYFHGNASHMGNRAGIFQALQAQGFGVLALSYRGYGKSAGEPSEDGLYADARAAMDHAMQALRVPAERIILFGESLGTGVAVQMASEYPVGALVLQAAYISVAQRAAELYPYIPVRRLIRDHYHSLSKMPRVQAPLLMFHGELDQTIPAAHGRQVFEAAAGPKQAFFFPQVSHNDFDSALISEHVSAFARAHHLIQN